MRLEFVVRGLNGADDLKVVVERIDAVGRVHLARLPTPPQRPPRRRSELWVAARYAQAVNGPGDSNHL